MFLLVLSGINGFIKGFYSLVYNGCEQTGNFICFIDALEFEGMPFSTRGRYSTCGPQRAYSGESVRVQIHPPVLVKN
ncbi:MAG: hypothetical protein A2096_12100 [Spirochaetes bacterium GWF1_41_5]|nr:MAG: hypothetical protein A2096_12100 [Spirochaetes bacterium GWF1_41_5]HBE03913.1 hypothetical protein [Spirochaetia bacterium]